MENYSCFRRDRNIGRGGGLLFYVHNDIPCIQRDDLTHGSVSELLWLEICYGHCKIIIGLCYRPPGQDALETNNFLEELQCCLAQIYRDKPDCIILTRNFNDRCVMFYENHPTSELGNRLRDLVISNNM